MNFSLCVVALAVATQAPQGVAVPGPETVAQPQPVAHASAGVCNVCDVCDAPCETDCPKPRRCRPKCRRDDCNCPDCDCFGQGGRRRDAFGRDRPCKGWLYRDCFGRDCFGRDCHGCCSCCSTCNMLPHYAYLPVNYGYYYFRPYNWRMIAQHQNIACSWCLDPTNPYTRVMFESLYSDLPRATAVVPIPDVSRDPSLESLLEP
jgi:hypothetical protein